MCWNMCWYDFSRAPHILSGSGWNQPACEDNYFSELMQIRCKLGWRWETTTFKNFFAKLLQETLAKILNGPFLLPGEMKIGTTDLVNFCRNMYLLLLPQTGLGMISAGSPAFQVEHSRSISWNIHYWTSHSFFWCPIFWNLYFIFIRKHKLMIIDMHIF